jgi:hypothetical protein
VTGRRDVAELEEAAPLLESAARYVRQFRYTQIEDDPEFPFRLNVSFDPQGLERAVAGQGLPVWGRRRPGVLLWLGIQDGSRRYLVGGDSGQRVADTVNETAATRGVPVLFPLLDLEDQRAVTFADVAGGFQDSITAGSARYRPDGVLVGRVTRLQGGYWRGRWRLDFAGQRTDWETEGPALGPVLQSAVDRLADDLARRLASSAFAGPAAGTLVAVLGVESLEQFIGVRRYLEDLAPVSAVRPHSFGPGRVELSVEMRGDPRDLERIIGLGDTLAREPTPPASTTPRHGLEPGLGGMPAPTGSPRLVFRLLR